MTTIQQLTQTGVRGINAHLARWGYCYIVTPAGKVRIIRARFSKGVFQGKELSTGLWVSFPVTATAELS